MLRLLTTRRATIAIDVLAWAIAHASTGYAAHRLPPQRLARDGWLLRARRFEAGGDWYRRRLGITRWKDRLPEAGALFPGGISKSRLVSPDDQGLQTLVRESRRAELGHWWALAAGPVFALWNPPLASGLLLTYAVGVNLPFIAVQRYNRLRACALLEARGRDRSGVSPISTPRQDDRPGDPLMSDPTPTASDTDRSAYTEVVQAVVDRITSWQNGATDDVVRAELEKGLATAEVTVPEGFVDEVVRRVGDEDSAHFDVAPLLGDARG